MSSKSAIAKNVRPNAVNHDSSMGDPEVAEWTVILVSSGVQAHDNVPVVAFIRPANVVAVAHKRTSTVLSKDGRRLRRARRRFRLAPAPRCHRRADDCVENGRARRAEAGVRGPAAGVAAPGPHVADDLGQRRRRASREAGVLRDALDEDLLAQGRQGERERRK
ncbi:hypothetical protein CH63R_10744 [Colletotrichum higginsianum IMI 349063]|uniref:Uncharacterized protein n=1 Tax=Colletotrichum higginsianum (strain IMI 349063) TaxID=759273 RepID=A0A1B7Y3P8_COLHI|nr:uncharacterized protein CH63R_10744 [Colletotrichum higginsianum IMI 349063]OBR06624.1 hypothetical protein CH63R_10744 [Colletotrichum higginsianum IMI 349063]